MKQRETEIIPVIHVESQEQVIANIQTIISCGLNKIFLIDHKSFDDQDLLELAWLIKAMFPGLWVGVNLLGVNPNTALMTDLKNIDGLWSDFLPFKAYFEQRKSSHIQFFGGVAFKYQKQPSDLKLACEESIKLCDVSTTSGPGTGQEASDEKISQIREYLGSHPMAIASGVNSENISKYKGVVDYLLVASSITGPGEIIQKNKLEELVLKLKE